MGYRIETRRNSFYIARNDLDNAFSLTLETRFCGDKVSIGDTVEMFCPYIDLRGSRKIPWMAGKWILMDLEHYTDLNTKSILVSKLRLCRPSFEGNFNTTSLSTIFTLYKAKE